MVPVRFRDAIVRMLSVSIECSSLQRSVRSSNVNGAQHETALFSVGGRVWAEECVTVSLLHCVSSGYDVQYENRHN